MIDARARRALSTSLSVVALTSLLLSCSGGSGTTPSRAAPPTRDVHTSAPAAGTEEPSAPGTEEPSTPGPAETAPGPEKVRDAFAGLQATYSDGCTTPGNCAYFLGRVHDELDRLDAAMKADPQGPAHFREPRAWIAKLRAELGDDSSFENLRKHQDSLTGTRDEINTWMQGHPEDYR